MNSDTAAHSEEGIKNYNNKQTGKDLAICGSVQHEIDRNLPEVNSKLWHAQPAWFMDENPLVGYGKLEGCIRLMF